MKWSRRFRKWLASPRSLTVLGLLLIVQIISLTWLISASGPVTLSVVVPAEEAVGWSELVDNFEREYPNIRIDLVQGPYTTEQVEAIYSSEFQRDAPYDLVYMDVIWLSSFASRGWLRDLSDFLSAEERAAFLTSEIEAGTFEDRLYRIPFRADVGTFYYRQAVLDQAGIPVPKTLSELQQAVNTLGSEPDDARNRTTSHGYLWQGEQYEGLVAFFVELLDGYGGYWLKPNTLEVGLDEPGAIAAAQFLQTLLTENVSPTAVRDYTEIESLAGFEAGLGTFMRHWGYVGKPLLQTDQTIGLTSLPNGPKGKTRACRGGWGFAIAANTPHLAAAQTAIRYFTSAAIQRQFAITTGYLPSRRDLFTAPVLVEKYSYFPDLLSWLENPALSKFRPQIAQYDSASQILQRALGKIVNQSQAPVAAMQQAAQETRDLLSTEID
ncbi:MAG: extracellular solute-binding protein [Cyanobacteria bacterium P01_G01_bin.38]